LGISAADLPWARAKAITPPVDVPAIKSKWGGDWATTEEALFAFRQDCGGQNATDPPTVDGEDAKRLALRPGLQVARFLDGDR
jgi:hypothetical protein